MGSLLTRIRDTWKQLPQLVRFLLLHAAIGIGAGWLVLALLLLTDVNGVGSLIWASESAALAADVLPFLQDMHLGFGAPAARRQNFSGCIEWTTWLGGLRLSGLGRALFICAWIYCHK